MRMPALETRLRTNTSLTPLCTPGTGKSTRPCLSPSHQLSLWPVLPEPSSADAVVIALLQGVSPIPVLQIWQNRGAPADQSVWVPFPSVQGPGCLALCKRARRLARQGALSIQLLLN